MSRLIDFLEVVNLEKRCNYPLKIKTFLCNPEWNDNKRIEIEACNEMIDNSYKLICTFFSINDSIGYDEYCYSIDEFIKKDFYNSNFEDKILLFIQSELKKYLKNKKEN